MPDSYREAGLRSSPMPETLVLDEEYPLWQLSTMDTLKAWRDANGLTIPEAATRVGVERATWWRWENGIRPVGIDSVKRVASVTGIPANELRPDLVDKLVGAA